MSESKRKFEQSAHVETTRRFYSKETEHGICLTLHECKHQECAAPYFVGVSLTMGHSGVFHLKDDTARPHATAVHEAGIAASVLREVADELERLAASVPKSLDESING